METPHYTTLEDVQNYLLIEIDGSYANQIEEWIIAMSNYIDTVCHRSIFREEEDTFLYDGDNTELLHISDCSDITSVTVGGRPVTVFEYPQNKPYTSRIVLQDEVFSKGLQNVAVTGIHAMSTTLPYDIKFVCTVLVSGIVNASRLEHKRVSSEKIGNYTVTYQDGSQKIDYESVPSILSRYTRIAL